MSLINQMLKDLEGRNTQSVQPETVLTGLQSTDDKEKPQKKRNYLFLLGVAAFMGVWTWNIAHYYRAHHPIARVAQKQPQVIPANPASLSTPVLAAKLAAPTPLRKAAPEMPALGALTGISMQAHGKMTYLRFLLSRDIFYRVNSDPLEHSITLTLDNTRLSVNLPPLDFSNSALRDLQISSETKDGLKIVLLLKPEAKLSNLELNKESNLPELQADFLLETPGLGDREVLSAGKAVASASEPAPGSLKKVAVALSTDEQYQNAVNLAEAGETDKAIQRLAILVDKFPGYGVARETLISLLIQSGHQQQAQAFLEAGLRLQPYYPGFIEIKARFLVDEGKVYQALHLLKKAPPALATNPEYYAFLAALYQRLGQLPAAENLYQQLTALHPDKGVWWLGLGVTEEGLGKTAQAMEAYSRADRSPDLDPELRGYVGNRLRG